MKPWKSLTIADDYMFKRVMRNERICRRLLERILRVKILRIRYIEDEKTLYSGYDSKWIRLDVYVKGDEAVFDVEIQIRVPKGAELPLRMRYYQGVIDADILSRGQRYLDLCPCYIIFICPTDPFNAGRHIYTFENRCVEDTALALGDRAKKIFLNASGTMDDVSPELKAFLDYVKGIPSDDDFVRELDEEIQRLKIMEMEERGYMTFEMKMDEIRAEGREKWLEEGRAEGRAEGRTEGRAEGICSKTIRVVTNMLKRRYPYSDITELADTPLENVIRIAKDSGLAYS